MKREDYEEIEVGNRNFRIRKERSIWSQGVLDKIAFKDGAVGQHEVIKVDCQILDKETKSWREITKEDLDELPDLKNRILVNKIMELRKANKDFQETQLK